MALLRHVHLPYSVASDESFWRRASALGRVSRGVAPSRSDRGGSMERNFSLTT